MSIKEKLKEKFDNFKEELSYKLEGASKSVFIALGCLFLLIILLLLLLINQCTTPPRVKIMETFEIKDDYVFPESINMTDDYYFSREDKDSWSQEEVDEWFKEPDYESIKELSDANNKIINDIIGAAP